MEGRDYYKSLLVKYMNDTIAPEERADLFEELRLSENTEGWETIVQEIISSAPKSTDYDPSIWQTTIAQIVAEKNSRTIPHRIHFLKTAWFKYAAAVLIIAGIGAYLWNINSREKPLVQHTKPDPVRNDILPGKDRAILTLSNGQQVELNNATSETITDGTIPIKNLNGQLLYSDSERGSLSSASGGGAEGAGGGPRTATNTMTTPKGGQYQLTLSDGTRVWLNAASSITYPVAFTGKVREVSITGEAYFEVSKNPKRPFIVKTPKEEITVLGTSFNTNAYEDEPGKTSLIEGSVSISSAGGGGREARAATGIILRPGQAFSNGKIVPTNIDQDISWKNGIFNFDKIKLSGAMKQLARWYDIEVKIASDVADIELRGEIGRDLTLADVLSGLEDRGLHFSLNKRVLTVSK